MPIPLRGLWRKYAAMREIGNFAQFHREQNQRLQSPYGSLAVGGSDFDHLLKAVVAESYLRCLRRGYTPDEARQEAIKDGNKCVHIWNTRTCKTRVSINGLHELTRWDKAGEEEADAIHWRYLTDIGAGR